MDFRCKAALLMVVVALYTGVTVQGQGNSMENMNITVQNHGRVNISCVAPKEINITFASLFTPSLMDATTVSPSSDDDEDTTTTPASDIVDTSDSNATSTATAPADSPCNPWEHIKQIRKRCNRKQFCTFQVAGVPRDIPPETPAGCRFDPRVFTYSYSCVGKGLATDPKPNQRAGLVSDLLD